MTRRTSRLLAVLLAFSSVSAFCSPARAQRAGDASADAVENDWYYGSDETPKKSIAQQKAELRAQQRMDRLASMRWYGFQPGRPTASGMPFTTMYSPAWSRPGGRPFSWYTGYPTVVYNRGYRYLW